MTRRIRAVVLAGTLIVSHLMVLSLGPWQGVSFVQRVVHLGATDMVAHAEEHATEQFEQASPDTAREALVELIDILDRLGPADEPHEEYVRSKLVTLIRLSKVEETAGRSSPAADWRMTARNLCDSEHCKDCSDEALEGLVYLSRSRHRKADQELGRDARSL
jgi:hypothetical protein